ncbi:MAG: ABC transporter ATP-binding protein [Anaerolineae bacterium]|jgi:general nucleoside transport system ATP-binding protein|nr:ABC transporter ATP-binding protein [Anaerolineae bacterium]MBT7071745.1 ABC transporter ATP-binding protein [Anaerolineae bacterium]MBT7325033.1 ABC transporter ATP-binding protein [Anaerolineae bacterium]
MTSSPPPNAVEMQDIVIRFPGVLANDQVNLTLKHGEIHALLGENGAGKSTLMSALAGLYKPVSGTIKIHGEPVSFNSPKDAIAKGIGMVHQHFMLVPTQTVTENILLGLNEPKFFVDLPKYDQKIRDLQDQFGLRVDPTAKIWQLSVGEQQRVEILKTLYRGANILIMDEPTAVLAPQEIDELMNTMRSMTEQGKSIIFISHKLHEVTTVADRLTVLRKGIATAEGISIEGLTGEKLAELMVGRKVIFSVEKKEQEPGDIVLDVRGVSAQNNKGVRALNNLSLDVREGEILGIAGVAGNGQSELAEVITGLRACEGSILMNGEDVANHEPSKAIASGVSHIPEDRTGVGSAPNMTITENTIMKNYRDEPIGNRWSINFTEARNHARGLKDAYDILAPNVTTMARKLSGGNLQKVILAREITTNPKLMVAMQPTRGLDVGAIESIQRLLLAQREEGTAILLISEELDELLTLSDRIAVLHEGEVMGILDAENAEVKEIGLMMTGMKRSDS